MTTPRILTHSIAALLLGSASVQATDYFWNVPTGDWNTPTNWNPNGIPNAAGNFAIVNTGIATISVTTTGTPQDTFVGRGAGSNGRIDQLAGTHASSGWSFIGVSTGTGAYNIANTAATGGATTGFGTGSGTHTTGVLWVGGASGSAGGTGTLNVNTTGAVTATGSTGGIGMFIGSDSGNGRLNLDAGTVSTSAGTIVLGNGGGATGRADVSGGLLKANGELWIGQNSGTGTINITGGTVEATSWIAIGRLNATGTVNLSGGTLLKSGGNTQHVIIGSIAGLGILNQSGTGTLTTAAGVDVRVGENNGAARQAGTSKWVMTGGTANVGGAIIVGWNSATGQFDLSGGNVTAARLILGNNNANATAGIASGIFNLSGGTLTLNGGGDSAIGGNVAGQTTNTGVVSITGGTLINTNTNLQVGSRGVGTVNMSAGTVTSGGWDSIGRFPGSSGTFNMTGGTYTQNAAGTSPLVGEEGTGVLNVSGTAVFDSQGAMGIRVGHTTTGNGTINLNAGGTVGAQFIQKSNAASVANVNLNGGTLKANATVPDFFIGMTNANIELQAGGVVFNSNNFNVTVTQDLDGVGGLTKTGNGTLTLSGNPIYTGLTSANGGTLTVTGSGTGGGGLSVGASGALSFGNNTAGGMIAGNAAVAGALNFERSDDLTYAGNITGAGTVNKNRANVLTLSGTTTGFTGTMNVNAGALVLNNTQGGTVAVNAGGRFVPIAGATGSLTLGSLALNTSSTTDFEFGAGTNDTIVIGVGGTLSFGSSFTLNFYNTGTTSPFATNGSYTLFDYDTTFTGSLSNLVVGNPVPGKGYALSNNTGNTTIVMTVIDSVLTAWNNASGGLWTNAANWTSLVPNVATADATFGTIITAPSTVDIDGNKTVGKLTFDNANAYTIGGTGTLTLDNGATASNVTVSNGNHVIAVPIAMAGNVSITTAPGTSLQFGDLSGGRNLSIGGSGTIILTGAGGYSDTSVNGGTVRVGNGGTTGALGAGPVTLAPSTTLSLNRSNSMTVANNISGGGALAQDGTGTTTYTGTATHTGPTNLLAGAFISEGTINGTSSLDVENTTTLRASSVTTVAGPLTIAAGTTGVLNIEGASTATINGVTSVASGPASSGSLNIRGAAGATFNGALTVASGSPSTGALNINTTGTVNIAGNVTAGGFSGADGTIQIDSGTIAQSGGTTVWVGMNGGTGTFAMTGGSLALGPGGLKFADGTGGTTASGTITGGAITTAGEIWAGNNGGNSATVNISGGSVSSGSWFAIGRSGGTGIVNLVGGSLNKTGGNGNHIIIGSIAGVGTLNQGGSGVLTSAGDVRIGENGGAARSDGSLWNMSGGTASVAGAINVGWHSSTAQWNLSGGTVTAGRLAIGSETTDVTAGPSNGTATITGGTLNIAGAAAESRVGGDIAGSTGSQGTLNIGGGSTTIANNFQVGAYGIGTLNMSAGSLTVNTWPVIGRFAGGSGTANIAGGTFTQANDATAFIIGEAGTGILNVSGSGLVDARSLRVGHTATGNGTINLNGGTLATKFVQKTNAAAIAQFNFNGGVLRASADAADFFMGFPDGALNVAAGGANIDTNGFTIAINQSLTGVGTVAKQGAGTLTLNGAQSYAGLNANGGTTNLNTTLGTGASSATANAVLNISASQKLAAFNIGSAGSATLAAHTGGSANIKPIDTAALSITSGGKLDLTNNALVVRGGNLATITAAVASGLYTGTNGYWDGPGINSSSAAADTNFLTALGVLDNSLAQYPDFAGVTGLTGAEILVKYTYYGDSDLSGTVTADDFSLFLTGFNDPLSTGWVFGDYDYSGTVTADDFSLFLNAFNNQGGPLRDPALAAELASFASQLGGDGSAPASSQAVVPEPGSIGLLAVGALGLLARRRRSVCSAA